MLGGWIIRTIYNNGEWTQARFNSFIKSALRKASIKWPPRFQVLKDAFVGKMLNKDSGRMAAHYKCARCNNFFPQKKVEVNHKTPVIPLDGFDSWDQTIDRIYCEKEGLEVVCKPCHKQITSEENEQRKRKRNS